MDTSLESARDTHDNSDEPASEADDTGCLESSDADEGWYKPEMGTVLIEPGPLDEEI